MGRGGWGRLLTDPTRPRPPPAQMRRWEVAVPAAVTAAVAAATMASGGGSVAAARVSRRALVARACALAARCLLGRHARPAVAAGLPGGA